MYKLSILFSVIIAMQACTGQSPKIKGVSYVASGDATTEAQVAKVTALNANYAAVMPFGFIRDLNTPEIVFNTERQWYGERLDGVTQYVEKLHEQDLKVMMKPQIWIWRGEFTGYLTMDSEEDWIILEESYKAFILLYAELASELNVEIFCIGTELELFIVQRPKFWDDLISEVKSIYRGKLTYAANWDEYTRVPFWSDLDYIGVDGYFPVSEEQTPTVAVAKKGWQPWKAEMKRLSDSVNRPILFTEYGYRNIDYAGKEPWKSDRSDIGHNNVAQVNLYHAFFEEIHPEPWFAGSFIWKWFIDHE
ncbi:MAG: glycoside hydrolase, partial [Marinirhabdus sp.]|nr:glycoside hydrolase [Marinirhabdus sp.]